tara:strand:+ start:345 stop:749 length:405 start_codon:yes stop_codon:yes gene_type:complete
MKKHDDPNYVAKVEKAIAQKYGKEAIQHPRSDWSDEKEKDYLEQLKKLAEKEAKSADKTEKVEKSGFLISKKLLNKRSERDCPVCGVYSFKSKDDLYMNKYECCWECYIQYVDGREERWKTGWRPNNENHKSET